MSNHIRQHKSPYFYVQKGSGFVLLDTHEETQTRYKTEAEAKRAVLSLNDAWRAKHDARVTPSKSNPRRRNPEGDVSLTLWARPAGKTDALYEQPIYTVGRTMEDVERVKKLAAKDGWHTFRVQRIDLSKPFDAQAAFMGGVRGSRRRNPAPHADWEEVLRDLSIAMQVRSIPRYEQQTAALIRLALDYVPPTDFLWTLPAPRPSVPRSASNGDIVRALQVAGRGHEADVATGRAGTPQFDTVALARLGIGQSRRNPARRAARSNPRPPMRRNFFRLFKSAPPLYRVTAYNRDGSTDVHTSASHAALEIALDEAGIKERAIPGLMDAASREPLVDSSGDVFKRQKDAYGWYRVTIEMVGERPQAKSNPRRKYDESRDNAGYRKLSDLKKGEFFKRKADARKVYRKGDYDRAERKFSCMDTDDISREILLKGDTMVYVGFNY